ncbi:MAG: phenylalanine--tRNA ligase subunit beta [Herpetosiphon sp.]
MRVPLSWLRELVDINMSAEQLAEALTLAGLEVEAIDYVGVAPASGSRWAAALESDEPPAAIPWDPERVLIGEVLEVKPHPNADRLTVPVIGYGEGRSIEVVTGAPNIRPGMQGERVVLALGGARLIDGHAETRRWLTLKPSKLRGVRSEGMVCSELELGLSEEHEGILLLPPDAPVGTPLRDYLGEVVFDISITPNMSRALSIVGVAREVAAITGASLQLNRPDLVASGPPIAGRAGATIEDPELCRRMTVGLIEGITVGPSPLWLQRRLTLAGMRPINNIVDVSNYVMLELGEPTHAFDADHVADQHLIIRRARSGETLRTLDKQDRTLTPERLLIADANGPLSIAGVMGGYASEVSAGTTRVLLEAASFEPTTIRRSVQAFRLPSEAAKRFERGVDPELPPLAQRRCLQLMLEVAGGTVARGIVDEYPRPWHPTTIHLLATEVERLLGVSLSVSEIAALLERLDFNCRPDDHGVSVDVPSYRLDVSVPADLVEEVARLYGYHKIPATRLRSALPVPYTNPILAGERVVKDALVGCGLYEAITYSLTGPRTIARFQGLEPGPNAYLQLANPLTPDRALLRRELLPELVEAVRNGLYQRPAIRLFEIGQVWEPVAGQLLPAELRRLAIVMAGQRTPLNWHTAATEYLDYWDMKGILEALLERLHIHGATYQPISDSRYHPGRAATLIVAGPAGPLVLGHFGELHPDIRRGITANVPRVCVGEWDLDAILALRQPAQYRPLSNQPAVYQDLAVIAPSDITALDIRATITSQAGPLLEGIELFDQYSGPPIPSGQRSLAFRLTFRAPDRTLGDADINKIRERLARHLKERHGASVRGNES